jgi:hypothetical protein
VEIVLIRLLLETLVLDFIVCLFDWVTLSLGIGAVTFYGAFNVADNNSGTSGDLIYTSTLSVYENVASDGRHCGNGTLV